jgi:hypothetical protein
MQSARGLETRTLTAAEAHNEAMSLPTPTVVETLVGLLGATTVAEIAGVKETRACSSGRRVSASPNVPTYCASLCNWR